MKIILLPTRTRYILDSHLLIRITSVPANSSSDNDNLQLSVRVAERKIKRFIVVMYTVGCFTLPHSRSFDGVTSTMRRFR